MINILFLHAGAEMYGADKVLLDLVRKLDKTKFNPYVILPSGGILESSLKNEGVRVDVLPYPIMRRKYFNLKGIFQYVWGIKKYSKLLRKIAVENNIDIIHSNTAAVMEGSIVSKKLHIPHLWSIHEIIVSPRFMYKFTSRMIARHSSVTVTDSKAVKEHLLKSGCFSDSDIKVIYNGVDICRFNPENSCEYLYDEWNIPHGKKVIGMMGRVNSWKGQQDFLEAANMVMAADSDVYTIFIGSAFEGEEWREKELAEKIEKSPYKDRIINKGYRTDSQCIYKLFDVFVLPSINPDPLPTVVLEAMATGKPVIGYRHGGVCEMVEEGYNGLLADVRNPKDLADKICILMSDIELCREMGKHSRERLLSDFSMASYVSQYSKLYEGIISAATPKSKQE